MSPGEVGDGVEYLPEQVIADINWTDIHPIKQVCKPCLSRRCEDRVFFLFFLFVYSEKSCIFAS